MTPEQLIQKYREEFFNIFEYDPPAAELIEDIKENLQHHANHIRYLMNQIEKLETEKARKTDELSKHKDSYNTHLRALEILRSDHK